MGRLLSALLILGLIVSGCARRGNNMPSMVQDTAKPPESPQVRQAGAYEVIEGSTQLQGMDVTFDKASARVTLQGKMQLKTLDSHQTILLNVELQGIADDQGFAILKPVGAVGVADLQLAAKATCLGVGSDCSSNFIDIYIAYEDRIYHHQVESVEETLEMPDSPQEPAAPTAGKDGEVHDEDNFADEDGEEDGHDEIEPPEGMGQYVGDVENDIEKVLDVKPKAKEETPKKEEPKKEEPKKETPKPVTPKPEAPKQDPPKKDEPKKDPPKQETPKKDPPKKEEPKKTEPKKDDKDDKKSEGEELPKAPTPPKFDLLAKMDQAVGPVNSGHLERATDILSYQKSYPETNLNILRPSRMTHFGTVELAYLVARMGKYTRAIAPSHSLRLGDLSKKNGGTLGSHKSHKTGLDADIAYYFKADKNMAGFSSALKGGKPIGEWMVAQQWKLFKYAVSSKFVDRIFIHPTLKKSMCTHARSQGDIDSDLGKEVLRRLVSEVNHYNHFHLRIKCSKSQVRCRQMADPAPGTGC
ncbi:penicillin-insensitive murein endopeptidase [Bdellovibrio sp. HCB288]|uniref:penicillin-insensitive murein endopeptidase n=1 Tax=Bdellovibrio sp. HCB288 TaxID=3394355 RepID=UPI0039B5669E